MRRHQQATWDKEFLFGQLTAAVVNFSFNYPEKTVKPQDYMLCEIRKKPPEKPKRINRKKAADDIRSFFAPIVLK